MNNKIKDAVNAYLAEAMEGTQKIERLQEDADKLIAKLDKIKNALIESGIKGKLDNDQTPEGKKAWELLNLLFELINAKGETQKSVSDLHKEDIKYLIELLAPSPESKYAKCINSQEVQAITKTLTSKPNRQADGYPAYLIETDKMKVITVFKNGELKQEGQKLYLFALMRYKKGNPTIAFTVDEYMEGRTLKSKPKAIKAIIREAKKLAGIQIQIKRKSSDADYGLFTPFPEFWYKKNCVNIELSSTAQKIFDLSKAYEFVHTGILRIDSQAHPHSTPLILKLSELKAMNHGKSRDDIHKVKDLIRETEIPSYETVKERYGRCYKQRIIEPFERDMNASKDILTWEYTKGSGSTWKGFSTAEVKITWNNHPQDSPISKGLGAEK